MTSCRSHGECPDDAPLCDTASGECLPCDAIPAGQGSCEQRDTNLPICFQGRCVACTAEDLGACTDVCDADVNTCADCTAHDQCPAPASACHLTPGPQQGTCFPADAVLNIGAGQDFSTVTAALDTVPAGEAAVVVLHSGVDEEIVVDRDRVLLFRATPDVADVWEQSSGAVQYTLFTVRDATLYLDNLYMRGHLAETQVIAVESGILWVEGGSIEATLNHAYAPASSVSASQQSAVWLENANLVIEGGLLSTNPAIALDASSLFARGSRISARRDGISARGAAVTIVNTFVWGRDVAGVRVTDDSSVDVLYSTLGSSAGPAFTCDASSGAEIRNSIAFVGTAAVEPLDCGADVRNSSVLTSSEFDPLWFEGYESGDFHLRREHPFADVAVGREGDPITDIDGEPRPSVDGANDVAGADVR